jgi:hypothetical protein
MSSEMKQATITIACNILQNTAVVCTAILFANLQAHHIIALSFESLYLWSNFSGENMVQRQEQRGVANGISVTLMSIFKAVAPAAAGIL